MTWQTVLIAAVVGYAISHTIHRVRQRQRQRRRDHLLDLAHTLAIAHLVGDTATEDQARAELRSLGATIHIEEIRDQ